MNAAVIFWPVLAQIALTLSIYVILARRKAAAIKARTVNMKEAAVEPYVRLRDLYKVLGDGQMAENWRAQGYNKTGDATLAPGT